MPTPILPVRIAGAATVTPGKAVTTVELARQIEWDRDPAEVERRTGIRARYFAPQGTTAAEVATAALRKALDQARLGAEDLERIIFVNSSGGDVLIPATANRVAASLGLSATCDCFDLNNACLGFLSAFDVAARGIATGSGPVGVVAVELGSRFIGPEDPRPYLVFGDGAAAVIVEHSRDGGGILGTYLRNDGPAGGDVSLEHPGLTRQRETVRFGGSNRRITDLAIAYARRSANTVLAAAGLQLSEIEWILPHQPNGSMLQLLVRELGIEPARVVPVVEEVGSMGSASIPMSLDRLLRSGHVRSGDRLLMIGVGAGVSFGAILLRWEP